MTDEERKIIDLEKIVIAMAIDKYTYHFIRFGTAKTRIKIWEIWQAIDNIDYSFNIESLETTLESAAISFNKDVEFEEKLQKIARELVEKDA